MSVVHRDAHAGTGDLAFGSLSGHGQPVRRPLEGGAARGGRFRQLGRRGSWSGPGTLQEMADRRMRSYVMTEIVARGLSSCLDEAFDVATDDGDGVLLPVDVDVVVTHAPGTGTPEAGGLTARELLDAVRRTGRELPGSGTAAR